MELKDNLPIIYASSRIEWREWLSLIHLKFQSIWLVIYRKDSEIPSVYYPEAVDEALCFGWIDSKPNKRDDKSYFQLFSKRNPKSNWSKINKEKVAYLIQQKLMHDSGIRMVEIAKENGTWDALNEVDELIIPIDLMNMLNQFDKALDNWNNFPQSTRRGILEWIFNAKRPETRKKRIKETAQLAQLNKRANQFR